MVRCNRKEQKSGIRPVSDLKFNVFGDIGDARFSMDNSKLTRGLGHFKLGTLESYIGIEISDGKDRKRLNIGNYTDAGKKPLVIAL